MGTVSIRHTRASDIAELIALQKRSYPPEMPPWSRTHFRQQLDAFPQGQIVAEFDGRIVGCASSLIVLWDDWCDAHTWKDITAAGSFDNHNPLGKTLYGAEVFVAPDLRGQRIGHALYEGRRRLCRAMNLKRIIACGRLPGYHRHAADERRGLREARGVGRLPRPGAGLPAPRGVSLLRRDRGLPARGQGILRHCVADRVAEPRLRSVPPDRHTGGDRTMIVRIAAVQYLLRQIHDWSGFENQVRFVMQAAGDYRPHFVLLPEILTTQLLSFMDTRELSAAVRNMHDYTGRYVELMRELARHWRVFLIGGSHPTLRGGQLFNTAYLFTPDGEVHEQDKIHRTRWEREMWDTAAGERLHLFETPYGKIAILVCYDVEFPELARKVCEAGADILFVPSCTDDRQGFLRVRYCCHARAIENQVYVAMTSTVGSLPVEGLGVHYGQASIITPSDFPFSRDGIAAEGTPNVEQIIIADVNIDNLAQNRVNGTTIPLYDKRHDVYDNPVETIAIR
jgi:predicted amidohydrolase/GNAT superfamily N-acetyltransferase